VLVTDGGNGQSRSALAAVRALGKAGYEVHVTTTQRPSVAGWSRACSRQLTVPAVEDPCYRSRIQELQERFGYTAILPASDAALIALAWSGREFVDKAEVSRRSAAAGFPQIPEHTYADGSQLLAGAGELEYPVVVKPLTRRGTDDPMVWRADCATELAPAVGGGPLVVQRYLTGTLRAVAGVIWDGRLRAVVHQRYLRTWPRECGVACAAVSTPADEHLERRLVRLLDGFDGIFQVQLIGDHVIDVNPRVYGSMSLAVRAGVQLPDIVCRLATGEDVGSQEPLRARVGTTYRWIEGDLKHLKGAVASGDMAWAEALRAALPARGTAHGDLELLDPAPTAARLVHLARDRLTRR
jgi:hypothetical protein